MDFQNLVPERFRLPDIDPAEAAIRCELNKVSTVNATVGEADGTGIACDVCHGKGYVAFFSAETGRCTIRDCSCAAERSTARHLKSCGLLELSRRCTLDTFQTETETQQRMKHTVLSFLDAEPGAWLLLCGQSGAGKTHLCTAAFVSLVKKHRLDGRYFRWVDDGRKLKAVGLDSSENLWTQYQTAPLLYLDDLFKPLGQDPPTKADIGLAFDLLDFRYCKWLPTIISTERGVADLLRIDQATGARIIERCGDFICDIGQDRVNNFRLRR